MQLCQLGYYPKNSIHHRHWSFITSPRTKCPMLQTSLHDSLVWSQHTVLWQGVPTSPLLESFSLHMKTDLSSTSETDAVNSYTSKYKLHVNPSVTFVILLSLYYDICSELMHWFLWLPHQMTRNSPVEFFHINRCMKNSMGVFIWPFIRHAFDRCMDYLAKFGSLPTPKELPFFSLHPGEVWNNPMCIWSDSLCGTMQVSYQSCAFQWQQTDHSPDASLWGQISHCGPDDRQW